MNYRRERRECREEEVGRSDLLAPLPSKSRFYSASSAFSAVNNCLPDLNEPQFPPIEADPT